MTGTEIYMNWDGVLADDEMTKAINSRCITLIMMRNMDVPYKYCSPDVL